MQNPTHKFSRQSSIIRLFAWKLENFGELQVEFNIFCWNCARKSARDFLLLLLFIIIIIIYINIIIAIVQTCLLLLRQKHSLNIFFIKNKTSIEILLNMRSTIW